MRVSINEIEQSIRKAATACGWPYGIAEEFGRAASWAAELGVDAIPSLLDYVRPGLASAEPRRIGSKLIFPDGAAAAISAMDRLADPAIDYVIFPGTAKVAGLAAFAGAAAKSREVRIVAANSSGLLFDVGSAHCNFSRNMVGAGSEILVCSEPARSQNPPRNPVGGFELGDSTWADLEALAAKSYVPTTDHSRRAGAGAKASDND